jgi:hypothetical protein
VLTLDHMMPTSDGGSPCRHNLQLLHAHGHDGQTAHDGAAGLDDQDRIVEAREVGATLTSSAEDQDTRRLLS